MSRLGVLRLGPTTAAKLAAASRAALDRPLERDAVLLVAPVADAGIVLGALQRGSEVGPGLDAGAAWRRGSCGAEAAVGPGTLWMQLSLARSDALVACEPSRLLNRHVRPVLRALTRIGALAHYFDRDWISVAKRPVGMIAFAHDTSTGRALVEILLGVTTPFAPRARASYLGKAPATLAEVDHDVDLARLADAIVDAHASAYGPIDPLSPDDAADADAAADANDDPPWTATREEAIGLVGAGRGRDGHLRVGGELMVSRDAVTTLERSLAEASALDDETIARAVDASIGAPGVALLGVRSLTTLRDVLVEASRAPRE